MFIGIDASRAFLKKRTGIEEYSYQVIKHLRKAIPEEDRVVLYVRKKISIRYSGITVEIPNIDFELPKNWRVKGLWAPRFWTQARLSLEMVLHPPDSLFVPAHVVPFVHPKKTVVTIHGLEYEFCPRAYSFLDRWYMRISIWLSCRFASRIVAVSENTKRDLMKLYQVPKEKLSVVYEGIDLYQASNAKHKTQNTSYLLFVGRLEERKNIVRIIEAFEILKERYAIPHTLVLAGKPGFGYEKIKNQKSKIKNRDLVIELGYVPEKEKWEWLKNADVLLFPSLYEGFGLPVLEAQASGVPVVASNSSSLPEIGGDGALYVDPFSAEDLAKKTFEVLSEKSVRDGILEKGRKNIEKFSWEKCAKEIASVLYL